MVKWTTLSFKMKYFTILAKVLRDKGLLLPLLKNLLPEQVISGVIIDDAWLAALPYIGKKSEK